MEWTEVTIWTTTPGIDVVTGMLMDLGIRGFVIEDAQDFEEFLEGTELYWDYVDEDLANEKKNTETNVKIYVTSDLHGAELLAQVQAGLRDIRARDEKGEFGRCETSFTSLKQEDWENNWKQYFKPFEVGERFVIKPSWETYDGDTDRIILEIDPAASFGTGAHHTTQLVLCELEQYVKPGMKLLDMGCGSGILSIAAKLLGAEDITAADIDPIAVKTAKENAEKNGFELNAYLGDACRDQQLAEQLGGGYDIIAANIVADVIMAMQEMFYEKLKDDGVLIVSGIIGPRADEVRESLIGAGFEVIHDAMSSDWVAITLKKKL